MPSPSPSEPDLGRELLGYINFSGGKSDPGFGSSFNLWQESLGIDRPLLELRDALFDELTRLQASVPAFADCEQARAVIQIVFDECVPQYRAHHADLLFHLGDSDFQQPLFLMRVFEAVLSQGPPWSETNRVAAGAIDQLNSFLGFRPLAILENDQRAQPYPHERFCPLPLYVQGVGVAAGKYHRLIESALALFEHTPGDILTDAYFDLSRLGELALDVRAHDHTHPVNKRTNYMFGEWDPELIDTKGYYRRFVVRKIILDALLHWMSRSDADVDADELLYDASSVLCGTILMATSISGSGPGVYDSSVTLTSLLPKVAHQRDAFYERLLAEATGERRTRLMREAEVTQQPFGHVRQYLNVDLARYGAKQVQHRHLATLYSRMGYPAASRAQADAIPSVSVRFECEIAWRQTAAQMHLDESRLAEAQELLREIDDLLMRGIQCGGLIDPWNILGFQGQFPLFISREDSVPDQRAEILLDLMEQTFRVYTRALGEAAVQADADRASQIVSDFGKLAGWWDRFATTVVEDLPEVSGRDSWESATNVSRALSEWLAAGESAGDISFWRKHVEHLDSAKSYALVVEALMEKRDRVAAMGLLMQWLSEAETVGLESGTHSLPALFVRWTHLALEAPAEHDETYDTWPIIRRLFDYLEANAGPCWTIPRLEDVADVTGVPFEADLLDLDEGDDEDGLEPDDEDDLFGAAYDNVVFRDSAHDGNIDDTLDSGYAPGNTEFEVLTRSLEPRLKFVNTIAQLWQLSGAHLAANMAPDETPDAGTSPNVTEDRTATVFQWLQQTSRWQQQLGTLLRSVWAYEIDTLLGDPDSNVDFDLQLQTKYYLLHMIITTNVSCRSAEHCLLACLPEKSVPADLGTTDRYIVELRRGIFRRDVDTVKRLVPKFMASLARKPLVYIPFESGGAPEQVLKVRTLQATIRFLLSQLPQMGLLRETWHLLRTALRMERFSRPSALAISEFDRLFQTALKHTLDCVIQSSKKWRSGKFKDDELVEVVGEIVERYLDIWLKHSDTMRLSSVENLQDDHVWDDVRAFIQAYGADLLHTPMIMLSNVRAVLHRGPEQLLDHLEENQDPLHPVKLLEDIRHGVIERKRAVELLDLVYSIIVDKYDRYLEYNTTTTQSDYGERFYCLIDFLRVEADYERDEWNLFPIGIAHESLSSFGRHDAATIWEQAVQHRTVEMAESHLAQLRELEKSYGMRLPSISDRLNEQFVKPMAVNRMLAMVEPAMKAARDGREEGSAVLSDFFEALKAEVSDYLESTSGSGIDSPPWLHSLDAQVQRVERAARGMVDLSEPNFGFRPVPVNLREMKRQLKMWNQRLTKPRKPPEA